jgi:asparagine synthase (glutamine-hydrolysing)
MCGIVGAYYFDRHTPIDVSTFVAQADALMHRGPDAGAVWSEPGVALGQRRLSIIDVAGGAQPMWDAEGRVGVTFNGEIYNYRELRAELEPRGHVFHSDSDTETIIHAYREWGERCVERFRGMFAFAVYDRKTRTLLLARDRLGKKPLYLYRDGRRILFASEPKALLVDPTVPRGLEPSAVVDFFAYNYVPGAGSIFQGIERLPAGHLLVARGARAELRRYWALDFHARADATDLDREAEALDASLADAVRLRLRSDVPLGAFLSGGVDSSLVVAMMAKASTESVKTHTIGFAEAAYDERAYARETAGLFATDHHEALVTADATRILDDLSWYYDEPFGDASALPTYWLCEATRARVTVALSGDGGDESFAGYRRYVFALGEQRVRQAIPAPVRRGLLGPLARVYPKADYLPQPLRAKATLTNLATSHERAYFLSLTQKSYPRYLQREFLGTLRGYDPFHHLERHLAEAPTDDPLSQLQYADLKLYLCDDILVKVDRASMAHALEVRVPLLDHQIVEQAARLPSWMKLEGGETKRVLKRAAAKHLPASTFARKKMGFVVPIPEWLRGPLRERAEATLFDDRGGASGLLDPSGLRRLWYEHQLGVSNHATALWSLLMFETWYRRFLRGGSLLAERPRPPRGAAPTMVQAPQPALD